VKLIVRPVKYLAPRISLAQCVGTVVDSSENGRIHWTPV